MKKFKLKHSIITALLVLICVVLSGCYDNDNSNSTSKENVSNNSTSVYSDSSLKSSNTDKTNSNILSSINEKTSSVVDSSKLNDNQPQKLLDLLKKSNCSINDLQTKNCEQLITVTSDGNLAKICFFELQENVWCEVDNINCTGYIGKNGIKVNKSEGDKCTPAGLFGIGSAFYINQKPTTGLDCFKITEDSYWVDDPNSKFYNQYVEGTDKKDWESAEHMIDYSRYKYGFTINYNMEQKPDLGSAIFFHTGNSYTAGCVSAKEENVLNYLSLLNKTKNPYILLQ